MNLINDRVGEYFICHVEEITDYDVQLRTTSSLGEEGTAWLALNKLPFKDVALGDVIRVAIQNQDSHGFCDYVITREP